MKRILSLTGGLIIYERESDQARLVHETLQEYLRRWHTNILPDTQVTIVTLLRTYLCCEDLNGCFEDPGSVSFVNSSALCREHRLLDYAVRYYSPHINATDSSAASISGAIASRIAGVPILLEVIKVFGLLPDPMLHSRGFLPLHVAALSQCSVVQYLMNAPNLARSGSKDLTNSSSESGLAPIHLASMRNDVATAQILIQNGASVLAKDGYNRTPTVFTGLQTARARTS